MSFKCKYTLQTDASYYENWIYSVPSCSSLSINVMLPLWPSTKSWFMRHGGKTSHIQDYDTRLNELHTTPKKSPWYPLDMMLSRLHKQFWSGGKKKSHVQWKLNPGHPASHFTDWAPLVHSSLLILKWTMAWNWTRGDVKFRECVETNAT